MLGGNSDLIVDSPKLRKYKNDTIKTAIRNISLVFRILFSEDLGNISQVEVSDF